VALNVNFALAAVNALETTLYGSLLLASLLVFLKECRRGQGALSGLVLFFALMARPEASLTVAALFVVRLYWMRRRRLSLPFLLPWLLAFLVPVGLGEMARWGYYGQLLPNTYFAKAQPLREGISQGAAPLSDQPAERIRVRQRLAKKPAVRCFLPCHASAVLGAGAGRVLADAAAPGRNRGPGGRGRRGRVRPPVRG